MVPQGSQIQHSNTVQHRKYGVSPMNYSNKQEKNKNKKQKGSKMHHEFGEWKHTILYSHRYLFLFKVYDYFKQNLWL